MTINTLLALILALLLRTFIVQPFSVPTASNLPNLQPGDVILVSKWRYGFSRVAFPSEIIPFSGRVLPGPLRRGEMVVFRNRRDADRDHVKRIIGLAGDSVQLIAGRLYINGAIVPREAMPDYRATDGSGNERMVPQYRETLPGGAHYLIIEMAGDEAGLADNTPLMTVPPGHFFVLGDNRDNSQDSRFEQVGMVPIDDLIGKADRVLCSYRAFPSSLADPLAWLRPIFKGECADGRFWVPVE